MRDEFWRRRWTTTVVWVAAVIWGNLAVGDDRNDAARPDDDLTIRPTVIVRRGSGQGSGTIIASVEGETLILTAAHVVRDSGPIQIELHRYNLGVEQAMPAGGWPVVVGAEEAGSDPLADLAVVRVRGKPALPFVSRLAATGDEPKRGALVTSVGIDNGNRLRAWVSRVEGVAWFALVPDDQPVDSSKPKGKTTGRESPSKAGRFLPVPRDRARARDPRGVDPVERPFLITARAPEHGRSGGGLFLAERNSPRALIGVCVGRIDLDEKKAIGVFASGESVRRLLRQNDLETLVARSEAERAATKKD